MAQHDTYLPDYPPLPILERVRFAWRPVTLSDGTRCFLRRYVSVEQYHPARELEPWGAVGDGWAVIARHAFTTPHTERPMSQLIWDGDSRGTLDLAHQRVVVPRGRSYTPTRRGTTFECRTEDCAVGIVFDTDTLAALPCVGCGHPMRVLAPH